MAEFSPKIPSVLPSVQTRLKAAVVPIVAFGREYPRGHLIERHQHVRAQLIYASKGVMRIDTPDGIWIVPSMRAVWVPASIDHEIRASTDVCMRTLFIAAEASRALPNECCVIEVSPLLRELILRMVQLDEAGARSDMAMHAGELILAEINELKVLPLHLPMPRDPRLLRICRNILADPANNKTCSQWGGMVGASARTLERLFHKETGISFGWWRRQVRLLAALDHLAAGEPITSVALDMGYRSPSAFTVMFKRSLGRLPSEVYERE